MGKILLLLIVLVAPACQAEMMSHDELIGQMKLLAESFGELNSQYQHYINSKVKKGVAPGGDDEEDDSMLGDDEYEGGDDAAEPEIADGPAEDDMAEVEEDMPAGEADMPAGEADMPAGEADTPVLEPGMPAGDMEYSAETEEGHSGDMEGDDLIRRMRRMMRMRRMRRM